MIGNLLGGRVHFQKENFGKTLKMEDGEEFTIFRHLVVELKDAGTSPAVFRVRFKFASLPPGMNKVISMFPSPFLIGLPGFREKYWAINEETGYFQGIYQWGSEESARNYPDSFIFKIMNRRSAPGTESHEIIPDTDLSEYINGLIPPGSSDLKKYEDKNECSK